MEEDERILRGDKEDRYNERGRISICVYLTLKIYKINVAVLARLRTSFWTNIILINSPYCGVYNSERPISWNVKITDIKIAKDELFDYSIYTFIFYHLFELFENSKYLIIFPNYEISETSSLTRTMLLFFHK